jgi:hypothetical protein
VIDPQYQPAGHTYGVHVYQDRRGLWCASVEVEGVRAFRLLGHPTISGLTANLDTLLTALATGRVERYRALGITLPLT